MAFLGMRGTGDWVANQRPENWRQAMLRLYPNGNAPLTAVMSMMGSERTDDPHFHWFSKILPTQGGAITTIYTDSGMTVAITNAFAVTAPQAAAASQLLYIKVPAAIASEYRVGHTVALITNEKFELTKLAKVTAVEINGDDSKLTVAVLQAVTAGANTSLHQTTHVMNAGNANEEGANAPTVIAYDPTEYSNYTQIFRTSLSLTRTALRTKLRTPEAYAEAKMEALELHSIEMEKAAIRGIKHIMNGTGGKPERRTMGAIQFVTTYAPQNTGRFKGETASEFTGKTWVQAGEDWLDSKAEQIFKYDASEKFVLAGSGALRALKKLAQAGSQITLNVKDTSYGLKIVEYVSPYGTFNLKVSPLMSQDPTLNRAMLILNPKAMKYRFIDDTTFKGSRNLQEFINSGKDAKDEEFLTEAGYEFHHPQTFGFLDNLGLDNT